MKRMKIRLLPAACVLAAAVPAVAAAVVVGTRETAIVSPPAEAGIAADGDSDNAAFSQDGHSARLMAYDSAATNLVTGDTNGKRDVFLLTRAAGAGNLGGSLRIVSVAGASSPANGDSLNPAIDGDAKRAPRCVVFESTATNLDRADRAPDSDVFLRDLRRRRTSLVSVRAANGRNAVVDGECEFVSYEAAGSVWVRDLKLRKSFKLDRGGNPDQSTNGKGVVYERGGQIYHQGFIRKFRSKKKGGPFIRKQGRRILVSAGGDGAGNGPSRNPVIDDNGYYVAFESDATNLCRGVCQGISADTNGATDVFRRNINPRKAPTQDVMQMVSYSQGCTRTDPSAKTVDAQGNGPSNNPAITGAGENILFDSEATNLRESSGIQIADGNGPIRDIYYWNFPRERQCGNVSRESRSSGDRATGQPYNGQSVKPAASNRANYIGFTSLQAGDQGEANGPLVADVFMRFLGASDEGRQE